VTVIFCAGATLQAIEVLSEYFVGRGPIFDAAFGEKLLAIFLLVILALLFFLLHYAVRALRSGWLPRRAPPRSR
jgi:predicted permease